MSVSPLVKVMTVIEFETALEQARKAGYERGRKSASTSRQESFNDGYRHAQRALEINAAATAPGVLTPMVDAALKGEIARYVVECRLCGGVEGAYVDFCHVKGCPMRSEETNAAGGKP